MMQLTYKMECDVKKWKIDTVTCATINF